MILHTGGLAFGAILTRSSSASSANFIASLADIMPSCSPFEPIRRISLSLICSLIIKSLMVLYLQIKIKKVDRQTIHNQTHNTSKSRNINAESPLCSGESGYSTLFSQHWYFITDSMGRQYFFRIFLLNSHKRKTTEILPSSPLSLDLACLLF